MKRHPRGPIIVALAAAFAAPSPEARAEGSERPSSDCGTIALFHLLNFSGPNRSFEEVAAALPGRDPRGHSLAELRAGASRLGLAVEGIRLLDAGRSPVPPMIAFIERGEHGHFVALRPVGHTGHLVQMFDGLADPEVIDRGDLIRLPGWTGLGLEPGGARRTYRTVATLAASAVLLGLGGLGAIAIRRRRS